MPSIAVIVASAAPTRRASCIAHVSDLQRQGANTCTYMHMHMHMHMHLHMHMYMYMHMCM